jgi:hypothetical protein
MVSLALQLWVKWEMTPATAGPSTLLRSARDDNIVILPQGMPQVSANPQLYQDCGFSPNSPVDWLFSPMCDPRHNLLTV